MPEPAQPVTRIRLRLAAPREQRRLLGGEPEELVLLLPEPLRQRGTELHVAREQVAEHRDPGFAGRLALLPRADVEGEHTVDRVGQRAHVARVDQDLPRPVRRHRRLDRRVGERDGVHEQQIPTSPAVHRVDQPGEVVAVVERLREWVLGLLPPAVLVALPLAVVAGDLPALDLKAHDRAVRVGEHEVDLPVLRSFPRVADQPGHRVKRQPVVGQLLLELVEYLEFGW